MPLLFRLLLSFYYLFILGVILTLLAWLCLLGYALVAKWFFGPIVIIVLLVSLGTFAQFMWALAMWFQLRLPAHSLELEVPPKQLRPLYKLVEEIAAEQSLPMPDDIRLAPDTVAYVYEDDENQRILVIGGLALAVLTQQALAGVIAHELGHFAAGDTRLSRRGYKCMILMQLLESQFESQYGCNVNPLVWLMRGYHMVFLASAAAHSRQQEYAADRRSVDQSGKFETAIALLHTTLPGYLAYVRFTDIAESCVETNQPMERIFAEHRRRIQGLKPADWQEALRKALAEKPTILDSHPRLKARLAALGVKPAKALKLAMEQVGPPSTELCSDWPALEKQLTDTVMILYQSAHQAKREAASIMLGRPV